MLCVKMVEYFFHLLAGLLGFLCPTEAVPKLPSLVIHLIVSPSGSVDAPHMIDVIIDTGRLPPRGFGEVAPLRHGTHLIDTVVNGRRRGCFPLRACYALGSR
jgi:hypothetical protein